MSDSQNWPAWRYGPNGAAQIFARAEDVPQGFVDSPAKVQEAALVVEAPAPKIEEPAKAPKRR